MIFLFMSRDVKIVVAFPAAALVRMYGDSGVLVRGIMLPERDSQLR